MIAQRNLFTFEYLEDLYLLTPLESLPDLLGKRVIFYCLLKNKHMLKDCIAMEKLLPTCVTLERK